ncbi:hypothetical protein [Burkholderia sp. BCC1988]|uniref:hypothetical protein n=1 Tax=Burkholderia sp. BCC1988 TaxID=2817443 RepID=UPI002AB26843|nr:hypothetical protein [Burkholderia sp. BCC1988]
MKILALALLLIASVSMGMPARASDSIQLRPILSCTLADGSTAILEARSHGLDGDELFVQIDDKIERAFLDMPDSDFVGRVVMSKCVGQTLVFALEYGSPYLKGVAIRVNPRTHANERIYFAEKALPRWLYSGDREMLVVMPNTDKGTDKRYIVYRYVAGKGQPSESTPTDRLPVPKRQLIPIN